MKKVFFLIFCCVFGFVFFQISVNAHTNDLNVELDNCMENSDLRWYKLLENDSMEDWTQHNHIDQSTMTLKYFVTRSIDYNESDLITEQFINEVTLSFTNSMKKWNDIYFYSYNDDSSITKNKVVNIEEGTSDDYNLLIILCTSVDFVAGTNGNALNPEFTTTYDNAGNIIKHNNQWIIIIDLFDFLVTENNSISTVEQNKSFVGAHEIGHVLGLDDIYNSTCGYSASHSHNEILMGYGSNNHVEDITYQDLAGVSITRGFHTDNDHEWLNMGLQENGDYKFVCAICNGVIYDSQYYNYRFEEYGMCNNDHTLSSNNMMVVGSNGSRDYIKCKYCRYIYSLENLVEQNYIASTNDMVKHKIINTISGLNYIFYENHSSLTSSTNIYSYKDNTKHYVMCKCSYTLGELAHAVTRADINDGNSTVTCIDCGALLRTSDFSFIVGSLSNKKYSINGSYMLTNGIIVLVENDIQDYLEKKLVFYEKHNIPKIS